MTDFQRLRETMVSRQIAARGIHTAAILAAMRKVPREAFVPEALAPEAYDDTPLPIGEGQTISQPYIVAYMLDALELEGSETVLDIGTGSGYSTALLAEIAAQVYSIERQAVLAERARERLAALGYRNVHVVQGDGTLGWPEGAPYDAIVAAASGPEVPAALCEQLGPGGRLVMPIGARHEVQHLTRVRRLGQNDYETERLLGVRFVPLVGAAGW